MILSRLHNTPPQHTPKHNNNNKATQNKPILKSLECGVHPIKSGKGVVDVAGCTAKNLHGQLLAIYPYF